ncbi:MAG: type II secretion system F family protein [Actinobacteria bacterium]|nr:type II secretion system F family protein [Actinomycetota bacterium]
MSAWLLACLGGIGAYLAVVPRHRPRRFAEDELVDPGMRTRRPAESPSDAVEVANAPPGPASRPARRGRSPRPGRARRTPQDLATCCDLLAVAATSGCTVAGSVAAVASVGTGPVATALGSVADRMDRGERFADALSVLVPMLGPSAQPLVSTLLAASSSGAPAGPSLLRLADAERVRCRRRIEARIRRLPVLLLLPLAGCVLPAFVLLTLVPAGVAATRGIDLPSAPTSRAGSPERPFPRTSSPTPGPMRSVPTTGGRP